MAEYELEEYDEYEDEAGEYEQDGDEYEEQDEEQDEEQEEEEQLPTQAELDYLQLRNKLKDNVRKKMKTDAGSGPANSLPYDDFGSFFGPSQPVIAQRVIEESKSLLENAERVSKSKNVQNKGGSSTQPATKPRPNGNGQLRRVENNAKPKEKIQMLKDTRDYSFLLSDDTECPVPPKNPPTSVPTPKPGQQSQRDANSSGRKVTNGREEREPVPTSSQSQRRPKPGQQSQRPSTTSKLTSKPTDSRKQVDRNEGSGPGRPSGSKTLPLKKPLANKQKAVSTQVAQGSITNRHKPVPPKTPKPVNKRPVEHKKDDKRSSNGNTGKKPVVISKPQIKKQSARPPSSSSQHKERPLKRPARPVDDDDGHKAISMIRNMFRYNPNEYCGKNDDDDSDMEVGFDEVMLEEKRSARIGNKEDEEEAKKNEEEERRERMRKKAKKRKLSNR